MKRHPWSEKSAGQLPMFAWLLILILLLPALSLPTPACAAPDSALQQSLKDFFHHGVVARGATAELIRVERWPATSGSVNWSLPAMHGHPIRFSMIAEQSGKRWYVPVRVHWWTTAIVMQKSIPARTLLTQAMLQKKRTDIAGQYGQWQNRISDLIGMRLTRQMHKGDVVMGNAFKQPPLIQRGELVTIIFDLGHLHIRTEGKAMRSAKQGDRLMVRNLRSKEVIQTIAERAGIVRVRSGRIAG